MTDRQPVEWIPINDADPMPVSLDVYHDQSRWWDEYGDSSSPGA